MTVNDIIEGNGPEYVLFTKNTKGKYIIMTEGENIQEIIDQLSINIKNTVHRIKERSKNLQPYQ